MIIGFILIFLVVVDDELFGWVEYEEDVVVM